MPAETTHITVNGQPLHVFQDAEKRDEIEQHRQDEIAGMKHRKHAMTSASPMPRRRQMMPREAIDRMQTEAEEILKLYPDGILFGDLHKLMTSQPSTNQVSYITGPLKLGCIRWKVINPRTGTLRQGLNMVRLRRPGEDIPPIKRYPRLPKTTFQAAQAAPGDVIPGTTIRKAPATISPLVGTIRAELVIFARAQRRLEKLRLAYEAKIAKLDRIHMANWWKLSRRLVLAAPSSNGDTKG